MKHQLGEGEEVNNRRRKVAGRLKTGALENEPVADVLTDHKIDPVDFFDPEEFGIGRQNFKSLQP
jgi:hypothetical protein